MGQDTHVLVSLKRETYNTLQVASTNRSQTALVVWFKAPSWKEVVLASGLMSEGMGDGRAVRD